MVLVVEEQQVVRLRSIFFQDGYKKVVWCVICFIAVIALMVSTSALLYLTKRPPVYFVTLENFGTLPKVALDSPFLSQAEVLQWTNNAMQNLFELSFVDYNRQLADKREFFTDKGWEKFNVIIKNFASYQNVVKNKYFVNGTPASAPFVSSEGINPASKGYFWVVTTPMEIVSRVARGNKIQRGTNYTEFRVLVARVPTENNFFGVAIDDIKIVPKRNTTGLRFS